jgi:exodeoxyribonuclease-1
VNVLSARPDTFYWYDYETFGTDPARDRPVQFAGLRTDTELNPVSEPKVLFCKPTPDYLPHPDACLITGITPQMGAERGLRESEFIAEINAEFSVPGTCVVGYNNIRFDDEVTRYTLYRNLMDPYAREWRNGNSRWDLIDVMRMTRALRPNGIAWPDDDEGRPTFKLDRLTVANGIAHEDAHDALSDVHATIAVARLVRAKQPRLFSYLIAHRGKLQAMKLLSLGRMQPVVHASSRFSAERGCIAVVVALAQHPTNPNGVVTYDLSMDPTPLIELDPKELHRRLFTPRDSLPSGVERLPLKTVHINKCPALAPIGVLRQEDAERLGLDLPLCNAHLARLKSHLMLDAKVKSILEIDERSPLVEDPDLMLYNRFIGDKDRVALDQLRRLSPEMMALSQPVFDDARLPEMVFRYRARNYPENLSSAERDRWRQFCANRLTGKGLGGSLALEEFNSRLAELEKSGLSPTQCGVLSDLKDYARMLCH